MRRAASFAVLVVLVAGFIIWSSALLSLYAIFSLGCEFGWGSTVTRIILIALWVAHLAAHAALIAWTWRRFTAATAGEADAGRFLKWAAVALAVAGMGTTIWTGAPILFLKACA